MRRGGDVEAFDYVIVGAGSAGCVLATRLSEDRDVSVLLLEAGPAARHPAIGVPAAFPTLFGSRLDWAYRTVPQTTLLGRQIYWPRGKVVGGSSALNAMMWVRGFRSDYDAWAELVGENWSYDAVHRYFARAEGADPSIPGDAHGHDGPLAVSLQRDPNPLTALWLASCRAVGIPANEHQNAGVEEGVATVFVNQRRGRRESVADAYLEPARARPGLTTRTGSLVDRVLFERGRAVGVAYRRGRRFDEVQARQEVILASGAIGSPQLLLRSGVGPGQQLAALGIPVVADRQLVGKNLQDHLTAGFAVGVERRVTLGGARRVRSIARYLATRRGLLSSNVCEGYGFVRSDSHQHEPDLELLFVPGLFLDEGLTIPRTHGVTLAAVLLAPRSRGEITLRTRHPENPPNIDPRYLSDKEGIDAARLAEGVRICLRVAGAAPLAGELGEFVQPTGCSGEDLVQASVHAYAQTLYHPVGTCSMGNDQTSVVDPDLLVRGVERLRVVDASVIPRIPHGHTNAAVVMIAERAAELVRSRRRHSPRSGQSR